MTFSSFSFLYILLPLLLLLYFPVKNETYRRIVLLVFSLLFYAWGEPVCVFLLIGIVMITYMSGILIARAGKKELARPYLIISVTMVLSFLVFFKYTGFFVSSLNVIPFINLPVPRIALPIGISFFSFQALSYLVDVYRGDTRVQTSFTKLLLYISMFPQLIAGPIVRYKDIEPQLDSRPVKLGEINEGVYRFAMGLAKKVIIANSCGAAAEALFALNDNITLLARWTGALFFTIQLYYDFSGYSDMAIGLGHIFGFTFSENFRYPFASRSATEFWRRWHISLGSFFRDYVYIPLGGNRKHHLRNIMVVWLLTGMWHGASWNFVLWGLYYGLLIVAEKYIFFPVSEKLPKKLSTVLFEIYFIFITVFGMAIFYFDTNLFTSLGYMLGIGTGTFTDIFTNSIIMQNILLLAVSLVFSMPVVPKIQSLIIKRAGPDNAYQVLRYVKLAVSVALVAVSTIMMAGSSYQPFLYFRF